MGCLLELFFEVFVEAIIELIGYTYLQLMLLIVPNKTVTDRTKKVIRNVAMTVAAVLAVTLIIGLIFMFQNDPLIQSIGRYMVNIPLMIMALQITLGLAARIIAHFRK